MIAAVIDADDSETGATVPAADDFLNDTSA